MTWAEAFLPLSVLIGLALLFHGFPDIKIGGKHEYHYHNEEDEE